MKDINILAVDTSGTTLATAILRNDTVLAYSDKNTGLTHSETLMPEIINLFESISMDLESIDYFVCANGPGSFTGLRIGVSAMKGLAHAMNKPMVEVGTLDGLFYNIKNECDVVCPVIDARREEVYGAVYKNGEKILQDTAITLNSLTDFLKTLNAPVMFCGDGAVNYREKIIEYMGNKAKFPESDKMLQKGISVGLCGYDKILKEETTPYNGFSVKYLKPSQPEMQLNIKV